MSDLYCEVCGSRIPSADYVQPPKHDRDALAAENNSLKEELGLVLDDLNAMIRASGSRTNGGALGHIKALAAENARLREALRKHCIDNHMCHHCGGFWAEVRHEKHVPGCLAAPKEGA